LPELLHHIQLAGYATSGLQDVMPRKGLQRNLRSAAKQIGAESPTPRSGDAPKNQISKQTPAFSRVCQPLFADPKTEAEVSFGYAGAERMKTRWRARMQSALFGPGGTEQMRLWVR
jgi:hypothetical protein